MTVDQVIADLRRRFGHEYMLSAADIAVVLNQSEAALEDLISRDALPFEVVMVEDSLLVSIFEVAEWLAKSRAARELHELGAIREVSRLRASESGKTMLPRSVPDTPHSEMAKQLLQMRQANASQLGKFVSTYAHHEITRRFVLDVMERVVFAAGLPPYKFVLALSKVDPSVGEGVVSEAKWHFENGEAALKRTRDLWRGCFDNTASRLVLRQGRRVLFQGHVIGGQAAVLIDQVGCVEGCKDC
jgi:hypothetical protein